MGSLVLQVTERRTEQEMSVSRVSVCATLDHIRDLEEHVENCKRETADMDEEKDTFNKVKEDEIKHLVAEKEKFNKNVEAKKEVVGKDIAEIAAKIKSLVEVLGALNRDHGEDGGVAPVEVRVEGGRRPHGLNTVV